MRETFICIVFVMVAVAIAFDKHGNNVFSGMFMLQIMAESVVARFILMVLTRPIASYLISTFEQCFTKKGELNNDGNIGGNIGDNIGGNNNDDDHFILCCRRDCKCNHAIMINDKLCTVLKK
jgi:hypothetical protein